MEKDIAIGSAGDAKIIQANGKLTAEAEVSQPISVGGDLLGNLKGSVAVELDEVAVLKHFAGKYADNAIVQKGIELIVGAIQKVG